MDALQRAEKHMNAQMEKWIDLVMGGLALVFKRYWGWGSVRIANVVSEIEEVWQECAATNEKSMIQMLDEEVGIEIKNHQEGKSWRELAFLNADIKMNPNRMNKAQWIVMRTHQAQWMKQQIIACALIGLHRRYGFGFERLVRVLDQLEDVFAEFNEKPKDLLEAANKEANFVMKVS